MTLPTLRHALLAVIAVVLVLVGSGLVAGLGGGSAVASSASESSGRPDPALGRDGCLLMDRVFVAGGCSRTRCRQPGERIRFSPNAETCTIGGRSGTSYGSEIDSRTCARLHRRFVAAVNFCATNPHRDTTLIQDAPQCVRPFTAYVTTSRTPSRRATRSETEGRYDVCVRPRDARRLEREAELTGRNLRNLAGHESSALLQPGPRAPSVLMVGDSLTWRGTNELAALRPDWAIDGASGRNLGELGGRVARSLADRGAPTGLVIALGTNPSRGFSLDDLRTVVAALPEETPVMVVTPVRQVNATNTRAQVAAVARAAALLTQLVATRPHSCVADWARLVGDHRSMLVDGTHQTRTTEGVWATFVSRGWQSCLTR